MNNDFLIRLLFCSLLIMGTACGSDNKRKETQQLQHEHAETSTESSKQLQFERHEVEAYPDAIIEMYSPLGNEHFASGRVPFEFNIKNYPFTDGLKGFQFRLSINGGNPISYHLPIFQKDFNPGTYRAVAYLIDKEGLALKEFGNYVDRDFTIGDSKPFPASDEPYMVLNLPEDKQTYTADEDVIIDFLLIGGGLKEDKLKFLVEIDGQQQEIKELSPVVVKGIQAGQHTLSVKLVRENGEELNG